MAITNTAAKNEKSEISEAEIATSNNVVLYKQKHVELEPQPAKTDSEVQVYQPGNLPNNRPIAASNLQVVASGSLPNNRPIGSNSSGEDADALMGYID